MNQVYTFDEVGRLPLPGDNVAIATHRLEAGMHVRFDELEFELSHTVLEGHRFAVQPIPAGDALLSWELPFGVATRAISLGDYVCNASILAALAGRDVDCDLPDSANFEDRIEPYNLDPAAFAPVEQVSVYEEDRTFLGYRRPGNRGVGTRNTIVLLGVTSRTGSFVKQLEERTKHLALDRANIDGIVAVAHTEGGGRLDGQAPNNLEMLLRTLAGFMAHPNVGAVLAVDYGLEPVTGAMLREFMLENGYPLDDVTHRFLSLTGSFQENLAAGETIVTGWLDQVNSVERTPESLAHLKIALQCGGSDAFSGVSGNPLASWVAREVIRYGGAANLAETDELIGAEPYVLQRVRDIETAQRFLAMIDRFQARAAWHGHSAEGNPSGGNKMRGLYNIVLKSIGAAMKRHPDVRLDAAIDYSVPMTEGGYYFMDSPGNDLESIAGQVASGCNMIFFVTGNGSITNFPFAPTVKIVTTTRRFNLLAQDMDVNAGAYLDGTSMDELGAAMLDLTVDVASGMRSVGERAGHAQVQLWRDWPQNDASHLDELSHAPKPSGESLPIAAPTEAAPDFRFPVYRNGERFAPDQVGLILPTSLCAGQIARMAALKLNKTGLVETGDISRFVALVHTEGCGNSAGAGEDLYIRTMLGYLTHPMVRHALLLEHGCEKTHNDYMREQIVKMGLDPSELGWASVQLDGGIDLAIAKIEHWFGGALSDADPAVKEEAGLGALRVGLASVGPVDADAAEQLGRLTAMIIGAGGAVVAPQHAELLSASEYLSRTLGDTVAMPTLAYGQPLSVRGFHIMETPTANWVETLTGLGATGVDIIVAYVGEHPVQSHPMVPVLQISARDDVINRFGEDLDLQLTGVADAWPTQLLDRIVQVFRHEYAPQLLQQGNIDFQFTRGLLGISL